MKSHYTASNVRNGQFDNSMWHAGDDNTGGHGSACRGMTLIELLCVMFLITMFASLIFPGVTALHRAHQRRKAAATAARILLATEQYRSVYGHWPLYKNDIDTDLVYAVPDGPHATTVTAGEMADQRELIGALTTNLVQNPRNQLFLEIDDESMSEGYLLDPWGRPYILFADGDGDGFLNAGIKRSERDVITIATNKPGIVVSWGHRAGEPVFSSSTK